VNTTLDDLHNIYIATQKEAFISWFKEVVRSLKEVQLKKNISRKLSYSALFEDLPI